MAQLVDKAKNWVSEKVANVKKPEAELGDISVKNVSKDSTNFTSQNSCSRTSSRALPPSSRTAALGNGSQGQPCAIVVVVVVASACHGQRQ
ncbi:hypothetical protein QJS04_geneDACA012341 [Acorus gramineus]|uniref:Uncharacterized protein n=1 Tax=Acorus gramineus TaxID=55184 RepID=A0AAV9BAQ0_ACOGR|nr:hypothetical protein QJS04_geneDACA012341 [Acorus gramineus]